MRVLFINPPVVDPTLPSLGIASLVGLLRNTRRHTVWQADSNIQVMDELLSGRVLANSIATVESHEELRGAIFNPQLYRTVVDMVDQAKVDLRDSSSFFSAPTYRQATNVLRLAIRILNEALDPFVISEEFDRLDWRLEQTVALEDYQNQITTFERLTFNPLRDAIDARLDRLLAIHQPEVVGVSQVYDSQALLTRYITRRIKRQRPEITVVLGGTSLAEHVWRSKEKSKEWMNALFGGPDYLVVGEGESTLLPLLASIENNLTPERVPNLAFLHPTRDEVVLTPRALPHDLDSLPPPEYEVEDFGRYFSPVPVVLIAPTRGCFWDRCAFCAYGLRTDERATAPWREMSPDALVKTLGQVLRKTGSRHVIFAVDVLRADSVEKYAQAFSDAGLDFVWQAETRPDPTLLVSGRLETLARGGLRHISLGIESASQEVLDAMSKGTKVKNLGPLLQALDANNIAADLMLFRDFPTETQDQLLESLQYLIEHKKYMSRPAGLGRFHLIDGSAVQKNPERFGVQIQPIAPESALRPDHLEWVAKGSNGDTDPTTTAGVGIPRQQDSPEVRQALKDLCGDTHIGIRPWVGSTGSGHTFLYFASLGKESVNAYNDFVRCVREFLVEHVSFPELQEGGAAVTQGADQKGSQSKPSN